MTGKGTARVKSKTKSTLVLLTLCVLLVAVLVVFVAVSWDTLWLPSADELEQRKLQVSAWTTLGQILGGFAILFVAYWTLRRVRALEKRVEVEQEGRIAERFSRAVDQLGSDKLEVRLGGIYALEGIARESKRYHWTIMEIITGYIRRHTSFTESAFHSRDDSVLVNHEPDCPSDMPLPEIQTILTVIGRRKHITKEESKLDLRNVNISNTTLKGDFSNIDFSGSCLDCCVYVGSGFSNTSFFSARMRKFRVEDVELIGKPAEFDNIIFELCNLSWSVMKSVRLNQANLHGTRCISANLSDAHLSNCSFARAMLQGAYLVGAIFSNTDVSGADFTKTVLRKANLRGAIGLTSEQLDSAETSEDAVLPQYLL